MSTIEKLTGIREELCDILRTCEVPKPEPLWQLTDYCITMQSILDLEVRIQKLTQSL